METIKLVEETEQIIQNNDIPNQPQVLLELNEEMNKPEPNFYKISDLVGRDINLALKIMRIANAPFWGMRQEVKSIHSALVILGLKNFKNLVLTSCFQNVLKNNAIPSEEYELFYRHSLKTAYISRFLAENLLFNDHKKVDKEHAYLVGLFHDCGILIMAKKYQGYYGQMVSSVINGVDPAILESKHYQTNHCKVGGLLAKKWNLPHSLIEPILFHHRINFDMCSEIQHTKLLVILKMAEHIIANHTSCGLLNDLYNNQIKSKDRFLELLSFSSLDYDTYKQYIENSFDLVQRF